MGFDQKLKDLLRLQTTQPDAFTAELDEPWPGMRSDIELALGILVEYQRRGQPPPLLQGFQVNAENRGAKGPVPQRQTNHHSGFPSVVVGARARHRSGKQQQQLS